MYSASAFLSSFIWYPFEYIWTQPVGGHVPTIP